MTAAPQDILVVKLGALGDILLADGALQDIRAHHPDAEIHLLTRRPFAALMTQCPWVNHVHVDQNAPRWRLDRMRQWRKWFDSCDFARVYDLQNSNRTAFYRRWLARAKAPWSYLAKNDPRVRDMAVPNRHCFQLAQAGVNTRHAKTPSPGWLRRNTDDLLQRAGVQAPFVLLLPGASRRHPQKRWPHFGALSRQLTEIGMQVVVVLGPDEQNERSDYSGIILRDGDRWLSIPQLADVACRSTCVIGNDSGPTHLAASLDAPCIALFARDNPSLERTGIEERNAIRIIARTLADLPVTDVVAAVQTRQARPD